jgi:hypothetical protein
MMNDLSDAAHHRFLDRPNDPPRITVTSTAAYSQVNSAGGVQLYIQATQTPVFVSGNEGSRFLASMERLIGLAGLGRW